MSAWTAATPGWRWTMRAAATRCVAVGTLAVAGSGVDDCSTWVLDLLVGWSLCACGLAALMRSRERRTAVLLVGSGVAWFLPDFAPAAAGALAWLLSRTLYLHLGLLIAEGRSNRGIAARLHVTDRTVETHVSAIFAKLGLEEEPERHRRVQAVLAFLRT